MENGMEMVYIDILMEINSMENGKMMKSFMDATSFTREVAFKEDSKTIK
jgi:hypothetical protein